MYNLATMQQHSDTRFAASKLSVEAHDQLCDALLHVRRIEYEILRGVPPSHAKQQAHLKLEEFVLWLEKALRT